MDWNQLADYRCPKCHAHLRLLRLRKIFVCGASCEFVIGTEKRAEIAKKYPCTIPNLAPYMEQILAII